jgi:LacI family transcriptional regulator
MNSENSSALDAAHVRFFQSRRVDGMILSLVSETDEATIAALRGVASPMVVVDRELPADIRASAVVNDHRAGMVEAVRELVRLGHRRIALITGALETLPGRERQRAMEEVIDATEGAVEGIYLPGSFSAEHGEAATRQLLRMDRRPTAIVCGANQVLVGCLRVLREHSLEVGKEVSIVTCDDVPLSGLYQPPIASISRDTVGLGRTAAELLLDRLGEGPPERVVLPTTFTPRASCAPPPG